MLFSKEKHFRLFNNCPTTALPSAWYNGLGRGKTGRGWAEVDRGDLQDQGAGEGKEEAREGAGEVEGGAAEGGV